MSNQYKRDLKKSVFKRDGHACLICGSRNNLTLDHIIPKSKGGRLIYNNLQTLCEHCNKSKEDRVADVRNIHIKIICKIELPKYKKGRFR